MHWIYIIGGGVLIWALMEAMIRWWVSRPLKLMRPLQPENSFAVRVTDDSVSCTRPDGTLEQVRWAELEKVSILNTSDGPLLPDQFWVLQGGSSGCVIPCGAVGDAELLARLQQLPGFDNLAILGTVGCTSDQLTLCWERGRSGVGESSSSTVN